MITMKEVCNITPTRAEVYENRIIYFKPCGVKYSDKHEVHCEKYANGMCEYIVKKHIEQQQLESYLFEFDCKDD